LRDQYIIVSLAGVPLYNKYPERGHYYTDHGALARELDAVSAKLRDETLPYAHRLAPGPFLFGAYSQGATMGALVLVERPEAFQRMILIEGGYEGWTKSRAQRFQAGGGQKVLWVCGTASCVRHAEAASQVARHAGLTAQVVWVVGGGHAYWGRVEDRVTERLSWLLE
jgi:predicted esterase